MPASNSIGDSVLAGLDIVHDSRGRFLEVGIALAVLGPALRGYTGDLPVRYSDEREYGLTLVLASLLIAGVMLLTQLPRACLWFIGMAIGFDLIVDRPFVALGAVSRRVPSGRSFART